MNGKKKFLILYVVYCLSLLYFIINWPSSKDLNVTRGYFVLFASYCLILFHFIYVFINKKIDIFEPIVIFFIFDILCIIVSPMIFIIYDNINLFGEYVMDSCIKATLIHDLCYIGFMTGYFRKRRGIITDIPFNTGNRDEIYLRIAEILWNIFFVISVIFLLTSGKSITYIFTLGFIGTTSKGTDASVNFLINFSYCLIACWLYICILSKSKLKKMIISFLTAAIFLIRGTRFIVIIMAISYVAMYYIINRKRPKIKAIIAISIIFIIFNTVMGYARTELRLGTGFNISDISVDALWRMLESNFNIYQTYYGVVSTVPESINHTYGQAMLLDPIIYVVPRFLWSGKPDPYEMALLGTMVNSFDSDVIKSAALATVWITEIYIDFGVMGCFIVSLLFGKILDKCRHLYINNITNVHKIIIYSMLYPTIMQFIIRGYMPMNIWMLFFLMLPVFLVSAISKIKIKL